MGVGSEVPRRVAVRQTQATARSAVLITASATDAQNIGLTVAAGMTPQVQAPL